ncbi:MAG: PH domain-containing protein [Actinomycetota bacterium]
MQPRSGRRRNEEAFRRSPFRRVYYVFPPQVRDFLDRAYDSLLPIQDDKILIADERILYKSRRHVAEIIKPGLAFIGTLLIFLALVVPPLSGVGAFGVIVVGAAMIIAVVDRERDNVTAALRKSIPAVILAVALAFVFEAPRIIAIVLLLYVAGIFGLRLLRWRFFRVLYLTNRRLIQTEGFFSRRQATLPLSRVTDVALSYSWIGEYLNYATFRVESAGQTLFNQIDFLASPERFHRMVVELATSPRKEPEGAPVIDPGLVPRRRATDRPPQPPTD